MKPDWKYAPEWFIPTRYPYTYAFDLLRELRPLAGENSRSQMSQFVTELCRVRGIDKGSFCAQLADIEISFRLAEEKARSERAASVQFLIPQTTKPAEAGSEGQGA
jgi:hypothetical protein